MGREPCKEEKERLKLQMECKPMLKPLEFFSLELNNGFVLRLKEVLYVPSLRRNLISVSKT